MLPDGTRQLVSVPARATAGQAATQIAGTFDVSVAGASSWYLIRGSTGVPLAAESVLGTLALATDEALALAPSSWPAHAPMVPPPMPPAPPLQQTATHAVAAQPASWGAPPTAWHGAGQQHAWGAAPAAAPAWATPSPDPMARRAGRMLAIVVLCVVVAAAAVGVTVLIVGADHHDDPTAGASVAPAVGGGSGGASAETAGGAQDQTSTAGPSTQMPNDPEASTSLADTPIEPSSAASAYSVSLPVGWRIVKAEEPQVSTAPTTRTRTQAMAGSGGYEVIIDALTNFSLSPGENRSYLDRLYASSPSQFPDYERTAFLTASLPSTTADEWQYVLYDDDKRRDDNHDNLMFDTGGMSFAVMTLGPTTTSFDDLSQLARRIARTVSVS